MRRLYPYFTSVYGPTDQPTTRGIELLWAAKNYKVVELVGGGYIINKVFPVFYFQTYIYIHRYTKCLMYKDPSVLIKDVRSL